MDGLIHIRDATPADAHACAAVHVASWQVGYRGMLPDDFLDGLQPVDRLDFWRGWIGEERDRGCILLAERERDVVGFGAFVEHPDLGATWAMLPTLYLAPDAIGKGTGAALMAAGLDRLRADGFEHVELWVHPGNQRARGFYEAGGWSSDGTTQVEEVWGVEMQELRMTLDL